MTLFRRRKLRKAYADRQAADTALRDAVWRNDSRAISQCRAALREATHRCMRLEVQ